MPIKLIAPPGAEPIQVTEARQHVRQDITDDDNLLSAFITAAREYAEMVTRRALVTQQWKLVGDRFPSPMAGRLTEYWLGQQWGLVGMSGVSQFLPTDRSGYGIVLPFPPLQTVDEIAYIDPSGTRQILDPSSYKVDNVSEPARIVPAYGAAWPGTRQEINAVEITFTCGYGAPEKVPEGIKRWMCARIDSYYQHRGETVEVKGKLESLPYIDTLLNPYRVMSFQ
jgi:hypothetical protein